MAKLLGIILLIIVLLQISCSFGLAKPSVIDLDCLEEVPLEPVPPPTPPPPPPPPPPPLFSVGFGLAVPTSSINLTTAPSNLLSLAFLVTIDGVNYDRLSNLPAGWTITMASSTPLMTMSIMSTKFTFQLRSASPVQPGTFTSQIICDGIVYGTIEFDYI